MLLRSNNFVLAPDARGICISVYDGEGCSVDPGIDLVCILDAVAIQVLPDEVPDATKEGDARGPG